MQGLYLMYGEFTDHKHLSPAIVIESCEQKTTEGEK